MTSAAHELTTPAWWSVHARLAVAATALALAAAVIFSPSALVQLPLLAAGVAVFGIPHGALDHLLGRRLLLPRFGRWWIPVFLAAYLGLCLAVILAWSWRPAAALAGFLLLSAVHFGLGDVRRELSGRALYFLEVLTRGALPLTLPLLAHSKEVAVLFGWLVGPAVAPTPATVFGLAQGAALVLAPAFLWTLGHHLRGLASERRALHRGVLVELAAIGAVGVLAPPLISFLVYFCVWHSLRHTLETASELHPAGFRRALPLFAMLAAPLTAVTLVLAVAAWAILRTSGMAADPATVQVLFIGLAALTVPHMALCAATDFHPDRTALSPGAAG